MMIAMQVRCSSKLECVGACAKWEVVETKSTRMKNSLSLVAHLRSTHLERANEIGLFYSPANYRFLPTINFCSRTALIPEKCATFRGENWHSITSLRWAWSPKTVPEMMGACAVRITIKLASIWADQHATVSLLSSGATCCRCCHRLNQFLIRLPKLKRVLLYSRRTYMYI